MAVAVGAAAVLLAQPAVAAAAGTSATRTPAPPVNWGSCPADVLAAIPAADRNKYGCAMYNVPLDYAHPAAGTVALAMLRRDPATNYHFNQRMAAELGSDRLVSVDAFGHAIVGGESACADSIAVRYLVDLDHQPFG